MQHIGREYGEIPQFKADFEFLTKDEKGAPYWLFDSGQGMDTFGNSVTFSGYEAGNLSHQSRAWRISYDFFQHHDAPFPADQVWELTLDIPEEGKSRSVELEKELMGIPIKLLNVTGPKTKAVYKDGILESAEFAEQANGTSLSSSSTYVGGTFIRTVTFTSKDPYIGVNFPQNDHSHRIEILAKHENGSYLPLSFRSRSQDHQFIGIREIPDSSELELKVIVKPVFRKSFLVQPMVTPPVHRFKNPDAIPERSPEAPPQTMDLSEYYTEKLDSHIHITGRMGTGSYGTSFNYFSVKPGIHQINNQVWDLRGIVLMTGKSLFNNYLNYPEKIEGIPIASRASKIHFLHGCLWPGDPDEEIGNYRIHYSNGTHQTIHLVYGKNIANVWNQPGQTIVTDIEMAKLVEIPEKSDPAPGREKLAYHFAWENPSPDLIIERIEIQSNRKTQAPLLLGITLE